MWSDPGDEKLAPDDLPITSQSTGGTQCPMPSTIQFQEIPIGQFFEFRGRRYRKLALSMASDEDRNGAIFRAETEVLPDPLGHQASSSEVAGLESRPQR
jgi:hypothetical protein